MSGARSERRKERTAQGAKRHIVLRRCSLSSPHLLGVVLMDEGEEGAGQLGKLWSACVLVSQRRDYESWRACTSNRTCSRAFSSPWRMSSTSTTPILTWASCSRMWKYMA